MHELKDLKEKFHEELRKIARKSDLSAGDLETVHKLTDTINNIDKICMSEEDGYSGDDWTASGNYSRKRYSRDGSREKMISKLENMLDTAENERTKSAIRKCINEIERD
ncbi:MAG: hypothetical protein HDT23_01330 [Ruminococcus sp.]|nr:hypothetical protein [Ruminococcus sp.]